MDLRPTKAPPTDIMDDDISLVRRGTNNLKLVQVVKVNADTNFAKIRILTRNKLEPQDCHITKLILVHRPIKNAENSTNTTNVAE